MKNDVLAVTKHELEAVSIKPTVEFTKRHIKVVWSSPTGRTRSTIVSMSCSDQKAVKSQRCLVRRMLREDGLIA